MLKTDANENVIGVFDTEEALLNAIKNIKKSGFKIKNVFTPYPIHEVFHELGLTTHLPWLAFFYAASGTILVFAFLYWTSVIDYPVSIGGKPDLSPSFIIVMFVATILFGIILSLATFFTVQRLYPGKVPVIIHEDIVDDKYAIVIEKSDEMTELEVVAINKLFVANGSIAQGLKNDVEAI